MTFSDQFIKVLDALCDKVGITIDWTSANVLPYLQNLMQRFVKYETYTSLVWIVLGIILFIILAKLTHYTVKKDPYCDDMLITFYVGIMILAVTIVITQTMDIIEVNTIPEKTIMEYVKNINQ